MDGHWIGGRPTGQLANILWQLMGRNYKNKQIISDEFDRSS